MQTFLTLAAAESILKPGEVGVVTQSGSEAIVIAKASGFVTFGPSTLSSLQSSLTDNGFASLDELMQKMAYLRDHAVINQ